MLLLEFDNSQAAAGGLTSLENVEWYARDEGEGALAVSPDDDVDAQSGRTHLVTPVFEHGSYGASAGPYLFHVTLWTPEDYRTEFLAWYEVEHLPLLLEARGWDGCRYVEETVPQGCLFHALHQLSERSALDSDQRKASRATPWFRRLAANPWFDTGFKRALYKRIER